jgi:hypothetical protein
MPVDMIVDDLIHYPSVDQNNFLNLKDGFEPKGRVFSPNERSGIQRGVALSNTRNLIEFTRNMSYWLRWNVLGGLMNIRIEDLGLAKVLLNR